MKRLIASMIAVAFLMTGSVMAANAGSTAPKAMSTARPAATMHVGHKHVAKKAGKSQKSVKKNAKKAQKPGKQANRKKSEKKKAGK